MPNDLKEAIDPFVRVLNIINALPRSVDDDEPLRNHLPGVWPTIGDLRKLIRASFR